MLDMTKQLVRVVMAVVVLVAELYKFFMAAHILTMEL